MLTIPDLPKPRRLRLYLRAAFVAIGVIAAFVGSVLVEEGHYWFAALFILVALVAALAEFVLADILIEGLYPAETKQVLDQLESNLRGYHDRINESIGRGISTLRACDRDKVSCTFHLKVQVYMNSSSESEQALVQVVDYSGKLGGQKWRFTSVSKGIVGRCLRTGKGEWVNFGSEEEYRTRMITEFGFTASEVDQHTRQARSYFAQPVYSGAKLIGVLYLFSTEMQVFPRAVNPALMEATANEIAAFLAGARIIV